MIRNGAAMCDKCSEIDRKIAHYKDIAASILDDLLTERIEAMIAELLAAKELLHPTEQE
jgi:hypothetical protein